MRENYLRCISHVHARHIDVTLKNIDYLEVVCISKGRGRHKKTWIETVRNDLRRLVQSIRLHIIRPIGNISFNVADPNQ